jgi:hypothetical protein
MIRQENIVGVALKYPIELDSGGNPVTVTGVELVEQSILVRLINTSPPFFLGELSCRLDELLFEQNDGVLVSLLDYFIREVIKVESRTKLLGIEYEQLTDGVVLCRITHKLVSTDISSSFVFPFYSGLKY